MDFTVNRKKWLRGTDDGHLLQPNGNKMCCLGFVCRQMGLKAMEIRGRSMPEDLQESQRKILRSALTYKTRLDHGESYNWVSKAADINDSPDLNEVQRIKKLKALFKKNGHKLKFID